MPTPKNRIVLDTNLWISSLLSKEPSLLDTLVTSKHVQLIFCYQLMGELISVAESPALKKYFSFEDTFQLMVSMLQQVERAEIKSEVKLCQQPEDNYMLALCLDGNATHFITENKEFLALKKIGETQILSASEYLNLV